MRYFKATSLVPSLTNREVADSVGRTRFFPYSTILECINQVHPINDGLKVVGYRVTDDGIELILE
jgi:hypothetical protein